MFGKVIELKRNPEPTSRGTDLPDEISGQFSAEVREQSQASAQTSRISHINFGRESYFGLISDASGKTTNVHITLDPQRKTLARATCGCFRANTRSYCQHVASFARYILRNDPETGKLRTLSDDFHDSFWNEISWYGYKHFGDSLLGFKAHADHGGGGIRIGFADRGNKEILVLMPGPRLVEEFLYEFFEIIRRDIDPVLFKSMFGRKLKDPRVPSLRRRPWSNSPAEDDLNRRGLKSTVQHYEESIWYRIAKVGFLIAGRSGGAFRFTFLEHKQELTVEAYDEDDEVICRLVPPQAHIGTIIEAGEKTGVIGNDLFIHPHALRTGHRIEVTDSSALSITPVVENPDPDAEPADAFLDRTTLDHQLYGTYYFFPEWGFFRIAVNPAGLPPEHFSTRKANIIPPEQITTFLEEYGDRLRQENDVFVDESLFKRRTIDKYQKATVEHNECCEGGVSVNVSYDFGDFRLSFQEIYEARKNRKRFLVKGDQWVDTLSAEFAWMDGLDEQAVREGAQVRLERAEYLRFLAFHDRVETHFRSEQDRLWFEGLQRLKAPSRLPSTRSMRGHLRGYQKNGYGWLWFLYENRLSGLLCDDMGLGKTHQVMALLTGILQRTEKGAGRLRFLVVCPTTVLSHWKDKILEYAPHLDPYIYHGTDRSFHEAFEEHLTIITSYGIALRDMDMLETYHFEVVVLDEIQAIKNKVTKTHTAIKRLQSSCTLGLTGTPIENTLTDLKALFDVVLPGYLMTDSLFENHFRAPIEEGSDQEAEKKLTRMIHPFVLRRKKEQVLKELPAKIEDVRRCALSDDQVRFYRDLVEHQGKGLVQKLKDPDQTVPYMHVFAVLNYLKQICNHPVLLEKENRDYRKYSSGKWELFVELLAESLGSGQKVVIFSQYVKMLDLIEAYLQDEGLEFATIKGHTRKRAEAFRRFNTDPECMVFTASLRAAGLGIDLTGGSVVIHYDRWWNSAREEQATDRVHRIGQRRGVQVFKLITENTLEEKIDTIISRKRRLMDSVVKQDDQALVKHFSREELIELISY
ncbi:MAG: DEAD/DEAH box helicase [Thermodesulfobacteriota bacterium]